MQWSRKLYALQADPNGNSKEPGLLHQITLEATEPGKPPFKYSTMMYIPSSLDKRQAELSLELFEDTAHSQLTALCETWRGRPLANRSSF
jgi:hypothetical protein